MAKFALGTSYSNVSYGAPCTGVARGTREQYTRAPFASPGARMRMRQCSHFGANA